MLIMYSVVAVMATAAVILTIAIIVVTTLIAVVDLVDFFADEIYAFAGAKTCSAGGRVAIIKGTGRRK